jgi:menaquinone-specific isochorismate synthase
LVQAPLTFSELLAVATEAASRLEPDGVLSLALPLAPLDPLLALPLLSAGMADGFRFLWDGAPGLCIAAAGRANGLELSGPRRFELAQRYATATLGRLGVAQEVPALARPRVLLAFSFFDAPLDLQDTSAPGVQAVLPRWQLSRHGQHCWLRLQRCLGGEVTARQLAEELWAMGQALAQAASGGEQLPQPPRLASSGGPDAASSSASASASNCAGVGHGDGVGVCDGHGDAAWMQGYRLAAEQALELVERGALQKLVLAVRQRLLLVGEPDPLTLLAPLRRHQGGSCRFLWQRNGGGALIGASPERLLTVRQGQLRSDALAGTATPEASADLLASEKERLEHQLVVQAIGDGLRAAGLEPRSPRHPRLARHGHLVHLHTPITASLAGQHPLALAAMLHPTPAVAGVPRREAMAWLRCLEPFERGHYAAPIGWIDSCGDTDLRVAIRSGTLRGQCLELTAGAGLVRGSSLERELREVDLKLGVLRRQLQLPAITAAGDCIG